VKLILAKEENNFLGGQSEVLCDGERQLEGGATWPKG
jgi:hypothetical protein